MKLFIVLLCTIFVVKADDDFSRAYDIFTNNLFKGVTKLPTPNVVVGPLSANLILGLTQFGSHGTTRNEFWNVLNLPSDEQKIAGLYKNFIPTTRGSKDFVTTIANKLYIAQDLKIKEDFKKVALDVFGAHAENVDFAKGPDAVKTINEWVASQTDNKIQDLLSPSEVSALTSLILVNTVNFNATFARQFHANSTRNLDFHVNSKKAVQVATLQDLNSHVYYFAQDDKLKAKFLVIPLKGGEATIIFVLPNEIDGLEDLEKRIDEIQPTFEPKKVFVRLPKFKIQTKVDLKEVLLGLNLRRAFVRGQADLSGIAGSAGDLYIDKIVQKNYISLDEKGVEAASATAVDVEPTLNPPKADAEFYADHPFLFYVQVRGTTIFGGRVSDPSQ